MLTKHNLFNLEKNKFPKYIAINGKKEDSNVFIQQIKTFLNVDDNSVFVGEITKENKHFILKKIKHTQPEYAFIILNNSDVPDQFTYLNIDENIVLSNKISWKNFFSILHKGTIEELLFFDATFTENAELYSELLLQIKKLLVESKLDIKLKSNLYLILKNFMHKKNTKIFLLYLYLAVRGTDEEKRILTNQLNAK